MAFWVSISAFVLFLMSGAAIAYVVGATSVLAYFLSDNSRYLAILPQ